MNYTFYKKQRSQKTFILLDGNGIAILRFSFNRDIIWWFLLALTIFFSWHQFADGYHRWVQQELNSYKTVRTVNQLQKNALANIKDNVGETKKRLLAIQKESNYFQYLLGLNPDNSVREIKIADVDKEAVHIQKSMLGNRIEKNAVVLNDQIVLEFYEDIKKPEPDLLAAEKRAVVAAKQLKNLLAGNLKKQIRISAIDENSYKGIIGRSLVFTVNETDSKYLSTSPKELAEQWAENINHEADRIAMNRKKINMDNFIAMPQAGAHKRLHKEILSLGEKVANEQLLLADIKKEVTQLSLNYAQTPSAYPLNRPISSTYGLRKHPITQRLRFHSGVDFWAWPGTRIYATASGRVAHAGWYRGYGYTVKIYHGRGTQTLYGHNSKLLVKEGAWVRKGQAIALSGATGLANGAHLHYEVRKWGRPVNPVPYLNMNVMTAAKLWE